MSCQCLALNKKSANWCAQQSSRVPPKTANLIPGFSLTPDLESFTPTFELGTPVFQRISSNLHSWTPTFPKICHWDSYFQNPSEIPVILLNLYFLLKLTYLLVKSAFRQFRK